MISRIAVFLLLLVSLSPAAHGRDINRQPYLLGERASGMGGAFIALSGDAAATWYNPAGLAGIRKAGVSLSASAYQLALESYTGILDIQTDDGRLDADLNSQAISTFPSSLIYVVPLNEAHEGKTYQLTERVTGEEATDRADVFCHTLTLLLSGSAPL